MNFMKGGALAAFLLSFALFSAALFLNAPQAGAAKAPDYCPYSKEGDRYQGKWAGLLRMVSSGASGGEESGGEEESSGAGSGSQ